MRTKRTWAACAAMTCLVLGACGGRVDNRYNGAQIGEPCVPAQEGDETFLGFDPEEVSIELPAPDADPGVLVCLADHFRGRVTCPYGQDSSGTELPNVDGAGGGPFAAGAGPCEISGGSPVTGAPGDPNGALVEPQCSDRQGPRVVTWSCRCANAAGRTDDGATYCSCPDGTECAELVDPVGTLGGTPDVSGAYCIPNGTDYHATSACELPCDPSVTTCS